MAKRLKMSSQALRDNVNHHLASTTVLAALGVMLDAQVTARPLQPALQARIDEVLEAFDLAWLPSAFIPSKLISMACENIFRALRPGGWLLFAMAHSSVDPVRASLVRLRTALWGGCPMAPAEVEILLGRIGLVDVRALPSPPGAIVALVAGRRLPQSFRVVHGINRESCRPCSSSNLMIAWFPPTAKKVMHCDLEG